MRKNLIKLLALCLACVLALAISGCGGKQEAPKEASAGDALAGVYKAMLREGSSYNEEKELYLEWYPDVEISEKLDGDRITIAFTGGGEYVDGSWDYVQDGDYLSFTRSGDNYTGDMLFTDICYAAGDYLGMGHELFSGYLMGVSNLNMESKYFISSADSDTSKIYIAAPWDMSALDDMYITEESLAFFFPTEDFQSFSQKVGKVGFSGYGDQSSFRVLISEYDGLDDLALKSVRSVASAFRPTGYEAFLEDYTALENAEGVGYTARLLTENDRAEIEDMTEYREGYQYLLVRFGT